MMMYIYLSLLLYVLVMVVDNILTEKSITKQLNDALVIIPIILRILFIK